MTSTNEKNQSLEMIGPMERLQELAQKLVEKGRVEWCRPWENHTCPTMTRMLGPANGTGKGLHAVLRVNMEEFKKGEHKEYLYGIAYRGGKGKDQYCFINYCPFCGEDWEPGELKVLLSEQPDTLEDEEVVQLQVWQLDAGGGLFWVTAATWEQAVETMNQMHEWEVYEDDPFTERDVILVEDPSELPWADDEEGRATSNLAEVLEAHPEWLATPTYLGSSIVHDRP